MSAGVGSGASPDVQDQLDGKVQSLFRGETLRGLLLASIAGFVHAFTTPKDEVLA